MEKVTISIKLKSDWQNKRKKYVIYQLKISIHNQYVGKSMEKYGAKSVERRKKPD